MSTAVSRQDVARELIRRVLAWPDGTDGPAVKRRALEVLERMARPGSYYDSEIERRIVALEAILRRKTAPPATRATLQKIVELWRARGTR